MSDIQRRLFYFSELEWRYRAGLWMSYLMSSSGTEETANGKIDFNWWSWKYELSFYIFCVWSFSLKSYSSRLWAASVAFFPKPKLADVVSNRNFQKFELHCYQRSVLPYLYDTVIWKGGKRRCQISISLRSLMSFPVIHWYCRYRSDSWLIHKLTHLAQVPHICVSELTILGSWSASSHYLNCNC